MRYFFLRLEMFILKLKVNYIILRTLKLFLCLAIVFSLLLVPNRNNSLLVNTKALSDDSIWTYYDNESECYPYVDFSPFTSINEKNHSIEIYTPEQLSAVAVLVNHPDKSANLRDSNSNYASPCYFKDEIIMLKSDIDLGAHLWEPIGLDNKDTFKGSFNGNNKSINNLFIGDINSEQITYNYIGLFGFVSGDISNLIIDNSKIYARESSKDFYAGFISGYISSGSICNCSVKDNSYLYYITCLGNFTDYVGGITGSAYSSNIFSCKNESNLYGFFNSEYHVSDVYIGGIVGLCTFTNIKHCENTSRIFDFQNSRYIGGIAGKVYCNGEIHDCHNYGFIHINKLSSKAGSIAGSVEGFAFHEVDIYCCEDDESKYSLLEKSIKYADNYISIVGNWDNIVRLKVRGCY